MRANFCILQCCVSLRLVCYVVCMCVYDFRVFRPRVSPFHCVHACFAAMCRKDCRSRSGERNWAKKIGREGRAARDVEWWWASRGARGKEGEARNVWAREGIRERSVALLSPRPSASRLSTMKAVDSSRLLRRFSG